MKNRFEEVHVRHILNLLNELPGAFVLVRAEEQKPESTQAVVMSLVGNVLDNNAVAALLQAAIDYVNERAGGE